MSPSRTLATTIRVLRQLSHDHRTIGLILLMPSILLLVIYYVFFDNEAVFGSIAPLLLAIFPFTLMFIITSVAVLRERTSGTLERLLVSPASRLDILVGYALAFSLLAFVQASVASFTLVVVLDIFIKGSIFALLLLAVMAGVLGMAFGLFFSTFAKNEFQAVQFMPAFVLPQFLTCGLLAPRDQMAPVLQYFSDVMPITYVVEAMQTISTTRAWTGELSRDMAVIAGFIISALVMGAISLRRPSGALQ